MYYYAYGIRTNEHPACSRFTSQFATIHTVQLKLLVLAHPLNTKTIMSNLIVDFPRDPIRRRRQLGMPENDDRTPRMSPPSVRFSATSSVHFYREEPRDPAARSSLWYSRKEKEAFKRRTREEISALRRIKERGLDVYAMSAELSPVGLEQCLASREFVTKRLITRRTVKMAVLTEQARGDIDPTEKQDRIARASRKHSRWSAIQAETIGFYQAANRGSRD